MMPSEAEPGPNAPELVGETPVSAPASPPPILPPVIVSPNTATPPPPPITVPPLLGGRLHPFTFFFVIWNAVSTLIIPAIVLLLAGREKTLGYVLGVFALGSLVQGAFRYFTFTYRIENGELITRQGFLEKTERNIPLARVQDIRIEQNVLHRVLGMVDVHVETAGGKGAEAKLSVLSKQEAERLRDAVFAQAQAQRTATGAAPAPHPDREVIRQLSTRELILAGVTSNRAASALLVLFAGIGFLDDMVPAGFGERLTRAITGFVQSWIEAGGGLGWLRIAGVVIGTIAIGMGLSAAGSVVLFHNFTLARSGEDVHRSYGLFTKRSSSLPRRRIQLLKLEEGLLRRIFKLATLRADTAGSPAGEGQGQQKDGHDVLLPIVRREEVDALLPMLLRDVDVESVDWQQVSRRAIRRGAFKGTAFCVVFAAALFAFNRTWFALTPLALIPLIYAVNVFNYRHLGYSVGELYFRTRRGWLSRSTHIVPTSNMQCVVLRETPFDRRHGVCTLIVDTAGQVNTGGGPHIDNVPAADAYAVARRLAQRAAKLRYRW